MLPDSSISTTKAWPTCSALFDVTEMPLASLSLVLTRSQEAVSATQKDLLVLQVSRRERCGLDWKLPGKIGLNRSNSNTRKNYRSREPSPTALFLGWKDYVRTDVMYKV